MNRSNSRVRLWLCVTVVCLFASACGTAFFYRHMDWLLIRFVEGYVELDESQQQYIRADLARFSTEIEQSVLPDLQALLNRLAEDNHHGRMAPHLEQYMRQVEALYKRTARLAEPGVSVLALSLDSEQQNLLFDEFSRRDKKFERKYIAKGEAHAKRRHLRTLRKNIRKWLGKIGAEQQLALQHYADQYQVNEQGWLDSRQRWRAELRRVLDSDDSDTKNARLTELLLQPKDFWTEAYQTTAAQNRSASIALTRQLAAHMNARQRSKFAHQLGKNQKKVANFAQAIATLTAQEMAAKPPSPGVAKASLLPAGLPRKAESR